MLIFLIICSLALAIYVTYIIVTYKPKKVEPLKLYRDPLYVIDGKVMCLKEHSEHLKLKKEENENATSN